MFVILKTRHPDKYEEMGRPSLIMNNTFSNNLSFIKFFFKREWRKLNDRGMTSLGNGMLVFFGIYTILFFWLIIIGTSGNAT